MRPSAYESSVRSASRFAHSPFTACLALALAAAGGCTTKVDLGEDTQALPAAPPAVSPPIHAASAAPSATEDAAPLDASASVADAAAPVTAVDASDDAAQPVQDSGPALPTVTWQLGNLIVAGNGCTKDVNAFVSVNGNDVALVLTNTGIDLRANGGATALADRRTCSIRLPARIPTGLAVASITQEYRGTIVKSAGANVSIGATTTFFGFNVAPATWPVPAGQALTDLAFTRRDVKQFANDANWNRGFCNPNRSQDGLFQANLAVSGQRDNGTEELIVGMSGIDTRFDMRTTLATCPVTP